MSISDDLALVSAGRLDQMSISGLCLKLKNSKNTVAYDHFQYALYKLATLGISSTLEKDKVKVKKLIELCYTDEALRQLKPSNVERFTGCLYHVIKLSVEIGLDKTALQLSEMLLLKKEIVHPHLQDSVNSKNIVYNIHSQLMMAAEKLRASTDVKNVGVSFAYALASIKCMEVFTKDNLLARKVLRNVKSFVLSTENDKEYKKIAEILISTKSILKLMSDELKTDVFVVIYLSIIKNTSINENITNEEVTKLKSSIKRNVNILLRILDTNCDVESWESLLDVFLARFDLKKFNDVEKYIKSVTQHDSKETMQVLRILLCAVIRLGVDLWTKLHAKESMTAVSVAAVKTLFNDHLKGLWELLSAGEFSTFCLVENHEICAMAIMGKSLETMVLLMRQCLKHSLPECLSLVEPLREAFGLSLDCLEKMKEFKCKADHRQWCWNYLIVTVSNAVEDVYRIALGSGEWQHLSVCCGTLYKALVRSDMKPPFQRRRVTDIFYRWHCANMKMGRWEEVMFISALHMLAYPEDSKLIFKKWATFKRQVTDEQLKAMTLFDVISKEKSRLEKYVQAAAMEAVDEETTLLQELKEYDACSAAELEPAMEAVFERLKAVGPDAVQLADGLSCVVAALLATREGAAVQALKKECQTALRKLPSNTLESLISEGKLRFCLFLCDLKTAQDSSAAGDVASSILDLLKKEEEERAMFGEDLDLNLTCDVVPSCHHVTVGNEGELLAVLDGALGVWRGVCGHPGLPGLADPQSLLHCVQRTATMYDMYGSSGRAVVAWSAYSAIARTTGDKAAQLLGLSHVMGELSLSDGSGLVAEAQRVTDEVLRAELTSPACHALCCYYLSLGARCLAAGDGARCHGSLSLCKPLLAKLSGAATAHTMRGRWWCLASQLVAAFPEWKAEHSNLPLTVLTFKAYCYINSALNDGTMTRAEHGELVVAMLGVHLWFVAVFKVQHQVVYLRPVLDQLYCAVQRLALPSRTAQVLALLAEVDLMARKLDDASLKFHKLQAILMVSQEDLLQKKEMALLAVPSAEGATERPLSPVSPTRFLNLPTLQCGRGMSPLQSRPAKPSSLGSHAPSCTCSVCRHVLVQVLRVRTMAVGAHLHALAGDPAAAAAGYRAACLGLDRAERHQAELSRELGDELHRGLDLHGGLVRATAAATLIDHGKFLLCPGRPANCLETVDSLVPRIAAALDSLGSERSLLQWGFLEMRLCALVVANGRTRPKAAAVSPVLRPVHRPVVACTPVVSRAPPSSRHHIAPRRRPVDRDRKSPPPNRRTGRKLLTEDDGEEAAKEGTKVVKTRSRAKPEGTETAVARQRGGRKEKEDEDERIQVTDTVVRVTRWSKRTAKKESSSGSEASGGQANVSRDLFASFEEEQRRTTSKIQS